MDIQSLINEKLPINKLVEIKSFNSVGQKLTLVGYVREIKSDGSIIWENDDSPELFLLKYPVTYKEVVIK